MDPTELFKAIGKGILASAVERGTKFLLSSGITTKKPTVEKDLSRHLREVGNWAGRVTAMGKSAPDLTLQSTIALSVHSQPRRFSGPGMQGVTIREDRLLDDANSLLVLGHPGSGKTTTLKRMALRMFKTPNNDQDGFNIPVVCRLRELREGETLFSKFADALNVPYARHEVKKNIATGNASPVYAKWYELRAGTELLSNVITELLNAYEALILIDGLDEIRESMRDDIVNDLKTLDLGLGGRSKLVVSSRFGGYYAGLDGLTQLEICPLSQPQIEIIAKYWLADGSKDFLHALKDVPYRDLADRPLLLTQLLLLFKKSGYLPDQPSSVYQKVTRVLLEEWDLANDNKRRSRYAAFEPDKKARFLSALSFQLTYGLHEKTFTEKQLLEAYRRECAKFGLPIGEARAVIDEIETHTGIISEGPSDTFEFTHLSLQEYLAADFIVRSGFPNRLPPQVACYSAPLAVAVSLSSTPGAWFGRLFTTPDNLKLMQQSGLNLASLISRIDLERPAFEICELAGVAMLLLYDAAGISSPLRFQLDQLCEHHPAVQESLLRSLRWYDARASESPDFLDFVRLRGVVNPFEFPLPARCRVPKDKFGPMTSVPRLDAPLKLN